MIKASARAALLALATLSGANAAGIDIRDCPLDTVVFVDPWAGESFVVGRVATNWRWQCEGDATPPHVDCAGPYGDLVLEGMHHSWNNAEPEPATATWTVIPRTLPCCGWRVEAGPAAEAGENFKWLAGDEVPQLREMQWLSIEGGYDSAFSNPLYAAACTLR